MEWVLVKIGQGVSLVCQMLADQSQVFVIGVVVGGIIIATGHKKLGVKVANTSVVAYLVLKVVSGLW